MIGRSAMHAAFRFFPAGTPIRASEYRDSPVTVRKMTTTLYLCYEPDHRMIADAIVDFPIIQPDLDRYDARIARNPETEESANMCRTIEEQISASDVLICVIGQTAFLDPWISWEIETYVRKPERHGLIGIMLHDLNTPPAGMIGKGSIFINFKKDALWAAIDAAMQATDLTEDFVIDE
jgi:Thoeris protein ThsB, TIR-like domain